MLIVGPVYCCMLLFSHTSALSQLCVGLWPRGGGSGLESGMLGGPLSSLMCVTADSQEREREKEIA